MIAGFGVIATKYWLLAYCLSNRYIVARLCLDLDIQSSCKQTGDSQTMDNILLFVFFSRIFMDLKIDKTASDQRFDRFLRKWFKKYPQVRLADIYSTIRK